MLYPTELSPHNNFEVSQPHIILLTRICSELAEDGGFEPPLAELAENAGVKPAFSQGYVSITSVPAKSAVLPLHKSSSLFRYLSKVIPVNLFK